MLKLSSLFYSVALVALMLTAPVTVRAEDSAVSSGSIITSPGIVVGERIDGKIEKHRDHIDARRAELDAKVEAWKAAHPGEALPPQLQEHVDRVENRLDKRDDVLDKREEIHDTREELQEKRQELHGDIKEKRQELHQERQEHREKVKDHVKDRVEKRHDRREGRKDTAQ